MTAKPPVHPITRWFFNQCDLKTLVIVGGAIIAMISAHYARNISVDGLTRDQATTRQLVDKNSAGLAALNQRITTETVSRQEYEHDTQQLNITLSNLANGQQQIYNLLIQQHLSFQSPSAYAQPRR